MSQYNQSDGLELRQIVLGHVKRILELSTHELKDGSYTAVATNYSTEIIKEDTRFCYIQSIENLSYVLLPFFDEKMRKVYDECIKIIDGFSFDVREILKKEYERIEKRYSGQDIDKSFEIRMKMKFSKKLFQELNLLLHRNDYLKTSIYGETSSEDIVEDFEDKS